MTAAMLFAPLLTIIFVTGVCVLVILIARSLIRYSTSLRDKNHQQKKNKEIDKLIVHDL